MKKKKTEKEEFLIIDERSTLSRRKENGILRRQVWCDAEQKVTKYSLAYINYRLYQEDNGRVLGYDNNHGKHHKHYLGHVEPIEFRSFTDLEEKFQKEFEALHETLKKR